MNQLSLDASFLALNISLDMVLRAELLSAALGFFVSLLYRFTQPGQMASPALQRALILLCMISSMVMMVIGNNLARAFSLVGALSIIRFRTRVRSPWDISFVFFALAAGIGCGVFAWQVSIVSTIIVALVVGVMQVLPLGLPRGEVYMLRCDMASYEGIEARVTAALDKHLTSRTLEEAHAQRFGEAFSYRYRLVLKRESSLEKLIRDLSEIEGVERVVVAARDEMDDSDE